MSSQNKIRVAVLTRGASLEAWEFAALEAVKNLPFAEIVLEIRDGSLSTLDSARSDNVAKRIQKYKWKRLFWNRWFKKFGKVNATKELSTSSIFQNVPRIDVIPELKGKHSQHFPPTDIAKVKDRNPDVIIRFGFNILRGEILNVAKHGVWSYHHADHETIRGGPASFWEYILKHNITGAILQQLTDKLDDGTILRRGYWSLVKHSFRENLDSLLMNSSGWIANALTEIHHQGKVRPQNSNSPSKAKVYSYPGNLRMIQFWFILFGNKIAFHWNNLFCPETWKIGIVDQPIESVINNGILKDIKWIRAKKTDAYLADPFYYDDNGNPIILAEEYCYRKGKGEIINALNGEKWILNEHHLSFPFVYCGNDWGPLIIPEASETGWMKGYEAGDGSEALWILEKPVVDPVIFSHNGKCWLFCHLFDDQNNAALFVYYADAINAEFIPHALNPVRTDIGNSRSAGAVLKLNGKLIRPAQDSAITYGSAIVFNEIVELTPTSFVEKPIKRLVPNENWDYNKGIHTINAFGDKTLIDAKSFRFNFANFKAQFSRKARRISGK